MSPHFEQETMLRHCPILTDVTKRILGDATYIVAAKDFCDDEFSDNDLLVMQEVIKKYGNLTAKELVQMTHRKGTLWYNAASKICWFLLRIK